MRYMGGKSRHAKAIVVNLVHHSFRNDPEEYSSNLMQYMGGKSRIAKTVAARDTCSHSYIDATCYEPFVGGAAVTEHLVKYFRRTIASDIQPDLILLYNAMKEGWIPPENLSEEEYKRLRKEEPSALRGFAAFGCSFGGKFFGGYARNSDGTNYAKQSSGVLQRQFSEINRHDVEFRNCSYEQIAPEVGDYVYCDPPYADTTGYSTGGFDHNKFWRTCERWVDSGVNVFISEYSAPDDWVSVWEKPVTNSLRGDLKTSKRPTEKLFVHQSQVSAQPIPTINSTPSWMESLF